jgi:hypothetical protein
LCTLKPKNVLLHKMVFLSTPQKYTFLLQHYFTQKTILCNKTFNSVVIQYRERDVQKWKNVKVYFKWRWNMSSFDINSVVFHFEDFNYGRRSQPYFFSNCNSTGFFFINYYIILNTCFIDVLQKLPSSQINLYCLSAEISKHQRYRSILHV